MEGHRDPSITERRENALGGLKEKLAPVQMVLVSCVGDIGSNAVLWTRPGSLMLLLFLS